MNTTADRLKFIMKSRNLRQIDIVNMCQPFCKKFNAKLQRNDLSQYINGKVTPSQYKLTILGLALNVNESWLLGFDVPMERETKKTSAVELTEEEKMIIDLFRSIPADKKDLALQMLKVALQSK